ncbi:TPA: hypothetical protein IBF34_001844 [Escherichia coli]|uniref:hypothetical protein n=1 Tax=Escherichia coli TaxID=562 RepID=UPI00098CBF75|nr:hypothetical protein [Escherichia coli]EKM2492533.1 hypothetical protein [Escherichia coli O26]ELJ1122965.1 hypothetical protein [Escherichia coli O168]EET4473060.1 hypothetical protein [Escherichia coli]EET5026989.1 hypothetical protein [Escherichia coli]EET5670341.1 hypothetical protein [Escherichia coli]
MANKTPRAIGTMLHRFRVDIPPFEVTTFSSYYDFGTEYYAGSKVGGESYTLMANTWRFIRFSEKDDDGMNKESEIIDELIEDERHDCDAPEVTEWKPGEKPPCGVWLDCIGLASDRVIDVVKFFYLGDKWSIAHSKLETGIETPIAWKQYSYRIHIDPKEKAMTRIAFALAVEVIGEDAAKEINFNRDNEFSRDWRNMAKAIINGDIPFTNYNGDE